MMAVSHLNMLECTDTMYVCVCMYVQVVGFIKKHEFLNPFMCHYAVIQKTTVTTSCNYMKHMTLCIRFITIPSILTLQSVSKFTRY